MKVTKEVIVDGKQIGLLELEKPIYIDLREGQGNSPGAHPRLLSVNEAAAYLCLHPMTVRNLIYGGELNCVRIGRAVRLDKNVLDQWISDHSQSIERKIV
jgi:excisionase family DNA binding protein